MPWSRPIQALLIAVLGLAVAAPRAVAKAAKLAHKIGKAPAPAAAWDSGSDLQKGSIDRILANYTFVSDFTQHPAEREVSDEIFWRYPLPVPKIEFPMESELKDRKAEMPATRGDGRAVDHLNRGRLLFFDGKFAEAKNTWLAARARFGKEYPFHRRDDYFIGYAFANLAAEARRERNVDWEDVQMRGMMANAATFLSWAFIVKVDTPDPLVDLVTPKGLYNLAAIYWRYGRFAGAYGAADAGLNFLRKTGRTDYRTAFHRIVAESHIRNRTYLEAVQALDLAIRQDRDPAQAAASFARVGDVYFDLNNYDLAEDAYGLGAKIDEDMRQMHPAQLVLRGESLFWLGRFSEAQKILRFALEGVNYRQVTQPLPAAYAGWAALRIADAYLARRDFEKAKLEYYKVGHDYRSELPGRLAKVREACLELPFYSGKNVGHARELLEEAKALTAGVELPAPAQELAWACQVGSYTDRERTADMLDRVRVFAGSYPESRFLKSFETPVREFQASHIEPYFAAGDSYRAVSFFEKTRKTLFPKIAPELGAKLFAAYADVDRAEAAAEFWAPYAATADGDLKALRQATVAAEMAARTGATAPIGAAGAAARGKGRSKAKGRKAAARGGDPGWGVRDAGFAAALRGRSWTLEPTTLARSYVSRVLSTPSADRHLVWIQRLARHWGERDSTFACDLEYPTLSRLFGGEAGDAGAADSGTRAAVRKRVDELIAAQLPALFVNDESCALSLLELEARGLRGKPAELAKRYTARRDWPLVGGFLHMFWTVAEHVNDQGPRGSAAARSMWEVIRDKGPPDAPESQFAKARLDPSRTEFERLWD